MVISDVTLNKFWHFIRGDMSAEAFEAWVYATEELETLFADDFYMRLISTDYSSSGSVFMLIRELTSVVEGASESGCRCHTLPKVACVDMGKHSEIFKTLSEKAKHGGLLWWLWLAECENCGQFWMIASEERINDIFIMQRMTSGPAKKVMSEGIWPNDFKTFESLLEIGRECGRSVKFADPISPALVNTIIDLARERPSITIQDISELLQVSLLQARALIVEAKKISFIEIVS